MLTAPDGAPGATAPGATAPGSRAVEVQSRFFGFFLAPYILECLVLFPRAVSGRRHILASPGVVPVAGAPGLLLWTPGV